MKSPHEIVLSFLRLTRPLTLKAIGRPGYGAKEVGVYILTFALVAATLGVFLTWHIASSYRKEIASWRVRVSSVADDRAQMVSGWLKERQGDAQVFALLPSVRTVLRAHSEAGQLVKHPLGILPELTVALDNMTKVYSYAGVYLLDRDEQVVAHSSGPILFNTYFSEACRAVTRTGVPQIDLAGDAPDENLMGFVAPVFAEPGTADAGRPAGQILGMVLVVSNVSQTLFPLLTREAVPTRTGETLLVRREGSDIVFFSPLRNIPTGLQQLRFPLSAAPFPARLALEGRATFVEYNDYRGVPVLAATQHIPLAGWGLVHKIDRAEALEDFRWQALAEGLAASLMIILVTALILFLRRHVMARVLKQEESKFRAFLESAPDAIYIIDPSTQHILHRNRRAGEMDGYSDEEIARMTAGDLHPPEDHALLQEGLERGSEAGRVLPPHTLHHRRKDGKLVPVEERHSLVETGREKLVFSIVRDITERTQAEAEHLRLVTAIEQSSEVVMITDPTGDIEYVNPAFSRVTGYSREEVQGKNPRILKSGTQGTEFYQQLWETILNGQTWHGELTNRRKDGSLYTEQMTVTPVRDESGKVTHFIATKQDATERKTLEEHLRQAAKMEAVGRLAGGVAHDFNNLLTIINGYTELLREKPSVDEQARAYLTEVKDAGERAASLTRQLLAFSRRQVLVPQVLELNAVVSNLQKMLARLIGEDIELRTVLHPSLWRVKADPGQIEQVIMNLAVNARDAMPTGGSFAIETSNVELDADYAHNHATVKPGPHVMLALADTGMGMAPETQAHLFEPFFTTKEQGKGTGLGLATVYGIVKQSGGSIWVYSELGKGTTFKVYLPAVDEIPASGRHADAETGAVARTETIMVVEDEQGVRSLICSVLDSLGYKVLETTDPESALATCASYDGPIHLLLTDVVMPGMSGPTVAEKVTALRPDIKILYMSGYTDDAVVHHGVLSMDVRFIQKPFSPGALRKKVREVLDQK